MRLSESGEGEVVRNRRNGSYYRYERQEQDRARIRPLELFPNGLLIPKSADTIVQSDLEVDQVGRWCDPLFVEEVKAERQRSAYEGELLRKREELVVLEAEGALITTATHGSHYFGSHANKVKAVNRRIESITRGLEPRTVAVTEIEIGSNIAPPAFQLRDLVQLPSGRPAAVLGMDGTLATVRTKLQDGSMLETPVDSAALRPWRDRNLATI